MEAAMRLPVSVGGALMPDAHLGCGLPVGGVLATEGAVIPWAVGVDIGCRMLLSIFDIFTALLDERRDELTEVLLRNTNFSVLARSSRRPAAPSTRSSTIPRGRPRPSRRASKIQA